MDQRPNLFFYIFYVLGDKPGDESKILEEIKRAHDKGADINPFDKNTGMTVMQTAEKRGFKTIVEYLKLKEKEKEEEKNARVEDEKR